MQQVEKTQRLLEKHGLLSFACIRMFFSRCIGIQLLVKRIDTSTNHRIMQYLRSLWSQNLKDGCYFQRWPSKEKHEQGAAPVHTSKQQDPSCPSDKCDSPHQDQGLPQILHSSEALACDASFRLGHDGFQQARISRIFSSSVEKDSMNWRMLKTNYQHFGTATNTLIAIYQHAPSALLPIFLHGDEGRGLTKRPLLILAFQPIIGWGGEHSCEHHQVPLALHWWSTFCYPYIYSTFLWAIYFDIAIWDTGQIECAWSKEHVHNETIVYHPPFGELRPKECNSPLFGGCFGERLQPSLDEWVWSPPTAKIHAHILIWCISLLFNEFLSIVGTWKAKCPIFKAIVLGVKLPKKWDTWRSRQFLNAQVNFEDHQLRFYAKVCGVKGDWPFLRSVFSLHTGYTSKRILPFMPFSGNLGLYFSGVRACWSIFTKAFGCYLSITLKGPALPKHESIYI